MNVDVIELFSLNKSRELVNHKFEYEMVFEEVGLWD